MNYTFSDNVASLRPSAIREILKFTSMPGIIPFAAGNPAPEAFPVKEISNISQQVFLTRPIDALQYSITEGYTPLREHLSSYMKSKWNVGRDNDTLIITSGAQQVMDLATKALVNRGETIICEDPSFIGSLNAFRASGAHLVGVPIESDGMNITALEDALKFNSTARFIYTIPNFQNPSGITMSLEKRKAVYALAKKYNVLIIEDNPYGDIRFSGKDISSIKSFDEDGLVIYAGSFSKVLAPGIRVGFCIAPSEIVSKMVVCKQTTDVHTGIWNQIICHEFITTCDYEEHLTKNKLIYKKKANLMMGELDSKLVNKGIQYAPVEGGLFIWCKLPAGVDMMNFCKVAVKNGVATVPGNAFLCDETAPCDCFRINFSTPTDDQIQKGIEILASTASKLF